MDAVLQLSSTVGIESACDVLGVARASFYRQRPLLGPAGSASLPAPVVRPTPARALSLDERESVRAVLNSERFQDCAPAAIWRAARDFRSLCWWCLGFRNQVTRDADVCYLRLLKDENQSPYREGKRT